MPEIACLYSEGPGFYDIYSIHQIEPIVALMNTPVKKVMFTGNEKHPSLILSFADGRFAHMVQRNDPERSFRLTAVNEKNDATTVTIRSDYMRLFIDAMLTFFDTGLSPVSHAQTVEVMAIRCAGERAMREPFSWISIE